MSEQLSEQMTDLRTANVRVKDILMERVTANNKKQPRIIDGEDMLAKKLPGLKKALY